MGGRLGLSDFTLRQSFLQTFETGKSIEPIEYETRLLRLAFVFREPASSGFAMGWRIRKVEEHGVSDCLNRPFAYGLERICYELTIRVDKL